MRRGGLVVLNGKDPPLASDKKPKEEREQRRPRLRLNAEKFKAAIEKYEASGGNQDTAGLILACSQPQVSKLMSGKRSADKAAGFIDFCARVGVDPFDLFDAFTGEDALAFIRKVIKGTSYAFLDPLLEQIEKSDLDDRPAAARAALQGVLGYRAFKNNLPK